MTHIAEGPPQPGRADSGPGIVQASSTERYYDTSGIEGSQRYPVTPGFKDQGTGRDAALAYEVQVKGRRAQVLAGLEALGPATAEQIAEHIKLHWYLTRPRLTELMRLGLVAKTGDRGVGALGGAVNVWRLTTDEERREVSDTVKGGEQ